jgi:hypothetical protein
MGNQAANGENKHQPDVSEETGLLNSIHSNRLQGMLQVLGYYSIFDSVGQLRISSKKGVLFSSTHFTAYR